MIIRGGGGAEKLEFKPLKLNYPCNKQIRTYFYKPMLKSLLVDFDASVTDKKSLNFIERRSNPSLS